ncbi:hypothetical protein [Pyrobaculum neutrophilum]|uniref:Uncharacterized protein n=1 Tax=Pyrobaculum neutrophilum (strain DSM 2338 / JCM 9278 / NBRC 100436 / V24Sta) TaxID=444157 RepID=B1YBI7_PYRNV|nr:hypothetical protein [Pyrobaculum neutrophilum]ACB40789.1 hypothetical protein Tneu_1874 [Pyrobaculum neutrophilum V24Sta]
MTAPRGISTVAAFAIFVVVMAVFMLAVLYYYQTIRQATLQGVQYVRESALPPDQEAALIYNGQSCRLQAAGPNYPFLYYISINKTGGVYIDERIPPSPYQFQILCPDKPGIYKYIGVRQNAQLAYLYVYIGPTATWLQANGTVYFVKKVGDVVNIALYLNAYNNSTGWAPLQYSISLTYDNNLLDCYPSAFSAGPTSLGPGQAGVYSLGTVQCRAKSTFVSTTIGAVVTQTYGSYSWTTEIPIVVQLINASATQTAPAPPSGGCPATITLTAEQGSVLSGYNELNGWIAAWGPYQGGAAVAVRPGVLVPDSLSTGTGPYYVELRNQKIATLSVSGAPATVTVSGAMPNFLSSLEITIGSYTVYSNGSSAAATLQPGVYPVYASVRAKPSASIAGSTATLYITCGSTQIPLLFEIPQWGDWGVQVDIYYNPSGQWGTQPNWQSYQYVGTWSVGSAYFWLSTQSDPYGFGATQPPYFSIKSLVNTAPKWAAAWLPQTSSGWVNYALRYRGVLYIPWDGDVNFGAWHDDGVYISMCGKTLNAWYPTAPRFDSTSANCGSGNVSIEIDYFEGYVDSVLIFVVGKGNDAYIPTIDGAYYCSKFDWKTGSCKSGWRFSAASGGGVPYFVVGRYTPGASDGGGAPVP